MGFPAFVVPREPMTEQQIDADPELRKLPADSIRRAELLAGHEGESWWHRLPAELKEPLIESFDGPCIWLDMETRLCKHHLHRPNVCRDFETGCGDCLQWRKEYADKIDG
jgi:Fe-S-cluster containining protein